MSEKTSSQRIAIFQILHALFWAFAILLASSIFADRSWSNEIAPWMALTYVIINGFLFVRQTRKSRPAD